MTTDEELTATIEAADRAYALLVWLGGLIQGESLSVAQTRVILSSPTSAAAFLDRHRASIPMDLRATDEAMGLTGNVLVSYLQVSFDLDDDPPDVLIPAACGPGCCWDDARPGLHLRTKKLTTTNRRRADGLVKGAVGKLAESIGLVWDSEAVQALASQRVRAAAIISYAAGLVARAEGRPTGPELLALWRRFAWEGGSLRKGFKFTRELVRNAEATLISELRRGTEQA